ncbi:MAG: HEAT repeat domain-containing protein [Deltaproteobacteria bacterium]|nr:HEAT repeat domain-containing protein [Deltaproteobacteria bacterium]
MAAEFGPHVERLLAVAGSESRRVAIGGRRDAEGVSASTVFVLQPLADKVFGAEIEAEVCSLAFLADDLLVAGCGDGHLRAWDARGEGHRQLLDLAAHGAAVLGLATDSPQTQLASVDEAGGLHVYRLAVEQGKARLDLLWRRSLSARPLRAVAIDPPARIVAAAGDDGIIRCLPLAQGADAELREMPCGEGGIGALAMTDDGRVVAGCGDGSVRLCYLQGAVDEELRSGEAGHAQAVTGLVYGPALLDEAGRPLPRRLFSVGRDGALKAWLLDSRRKPRTLELAKTPLHAVAWMPASAGAKAEQKGGQLIAVGHNRRLFYVAIDEKAELADRADRIASRLDELGERLKASSLQARAQAIEELGALAEDDARKMLDRTLDADAKPELRSAAAAAIGKSGRRLSRPALRKALDDKQKEVRDASLMALIAIEGADSLAPLRAALASGHADTRTDALKRLPALRRVSPLVPGLIAEKLSDPADEVRLAALDALRDLEGADSLVPIQVAFERGPADVRSEALLRLGTARKTRDPQGRRLLEAALDDEDARVRALAVLVSIAARGRLAARLRAIDPDIDTVLGKMEQKGRFADEEAGEVDEDDREPLFAALASRNPDTALRGARGLALLGDARAAGALLQLSREPDLGIRRASVEALYTAARIMPADERLSGRLEWLLGDEDAELRAAALEALRMLDEQEGPAGLLRHAERALRASRADIRLQGLQVLVKFGGQGEHAAHEALAARADELLGQALDDEDDKVRHEAFRTLWAWHSASPELPLRRAAGSAHASIRKTAVAELKKIDASWASELLLLLIADSSAEVGLAAYETFSKDEQKRKRADVHLAAMGSPRPELRAAGCKGCRHAEVGELRARLVELVRDDKPEVHIAAIEAIDHLLPDNKEAFHFAFESIFYNLRVRAGELCGKRRDRRAVEPMKQLLTIPSTNWDRPSDELRRRAARALADVGDAASMPFYIGLLDEEDPLVREMGARGLATACRAGRIQPLVDALSHADLAVRSWAAEGLARLGDERAVPVLTGTLKHEHRPIRVGAVLSFVALGPDGVRGLLQGLEDADREIQDLAFAIIVARDLALARAKQMPDLLLAALSSAHPEIRFAAARVLQARTAGEEIGAFAQQLVGPRKPERAADMKDWPEAARQQALLNVVVATLASDTPERRYAAAQVLALRSQPQAFWREAARLSGPAAGAKPVVPHTNWEEEQRQPRKKDWIRRLLSDASRPGGEDAGGERPATVKVLEVLRFKSQPTRPGEPGFGQQDVDRLVFGTYAGLVRQAPPRGEADETHRVRRDCIESLRELAGREFVGREAVLPVLRRALSDPHHLVRRAAVSALRGLYPQGALDPLGLALEADAADVGRAALDELIAMAQDGQAAARELALGSLNAPCAELRAYALGVLGRLFPSGSIEPWLLALRSQQADVRLAVVDRLVDSQDERVTEALGRALESDHEDLRLKAAVSLAHRGDLRTVDVLAGFLRSEDARVAQRATEALVVLASTPGDQDARARRAASGCIAGRLEDDPDQTADRYSLLRAMARIGDPAGDSVLLGLMEQGEDAGLRMQVLDTLVEIARDRAAVPQVFPDGTRRQRYREALLLGYMERAAESGDAALRKRAAALASDVDDAKVEALLASLIEDRDAEVRVAACESLAFRAEYVEGASLAALEAAVKEGRRELVLPAARGLASRRRPEAFLPLMLVLKAGEPAERDQAVLWLGRLGDRRAMEELLPLADPTAEIADEDRVLAPAAAEALGAMLPFIEEAEERKQARETVERLARTGDRNVRLRALTGLRRAGDERSRTLLGQIAGDAYEDASVRSRAIAELGLLGSPEAEPVLAEALDDYRLRNEALAALRRIFPEDPTRVSLLALRSRYHDVSQPAAQYLARRGDAASLVGRFASIEQADVRRRLRMGLVRRQACPARELSQLLGGDEVAARAEAAWMAGACGGEDLAAPVLEALERSAGQWRALRAQAGADGERLGALEEAWFACLWAARRLGADAGSQAVSALDDAQAPLAVRREALRLLEDSGEARHADALRACLSDPLPELRQAAAAALAALAPQRAAEILKGATVADTAAMAPMVAAALPAAAGELLERDATRRLSLPVLLGRAQSEELLAMAGDRQREQSARTAAIDSLGRMGGAQAEQGLQAILDADGEAETVRKAAFRALRRAQRGRQRREAMQSNE